MSDARLNRWGSAPTQHAIRELAGTNQDYGQTSNRQIRECRTPFRPHVSATTCGYYRTSSPVTAFPMITRWIFDRPKKIEAGRGMPSFRR